MLSTKQFYNSVDLLEYALMEKEGKVLFKGILEERNEMYDYVTRSLQRGGYSYRQICAVFKINNITVKIYEEGKIVVKSPQKIILFENQKLYVFLRHREA